jgi:probable HAF family extracellular repeat protein
LKLISKLIAYSVIILSALPVSAEQAGYRIQDLGFAIRPTGINETGAIVGFTMIPPYKAFRWKAGEMLRLETAGAPESIASGINNRGEIVGSIKTAEGKMHAAIWKDGKLKENLPGGAGTAMNDLGQAIGWTTDEDSWHGTVATSFDDLGGKLVESRDINGSGKVVGYADIAQGSYDLKGRYHAYRHAFLWQDGSITDLGTLGGNHSYAAGINESSQIVGSSFIDNLYLHAFLWKDGKMIDLGTLGGLFSEADSINDGGQAVGISHTIDGKPHACIWQRDTTIADLNDLIQADTGWELRQATAINNAGQIIGLGLLGGKLHGYLLTPAK